MTATNVASVARAATVAVTAVLRERLDVAGRDHEPDEDAVDADTRLPALSARLRRLAGGSVVVAVSWWEPRSAAVGTRPRCSRQMAGLGS